MKRLFVFFATGLIAVNTLAADVKVAMKGDPDQGRTKAAVCSACHGMDGNSVNSEWPSLAGQHSDYLVSRMQDYKSGKAVNALMSAQAAALSTQDMQDLAAHFASLPVKPGAADAALVESGAAIYRLGKDKQDLASCAACHGPRGLGNPAAGIPAVAGQRSTYVVNQLKAFASGSRDGGVNGMMADVSKAMTADDMTAVASFLEGLH